ncbi:hypothetical protein CMU81_02270 [Elizabethkingia anophelis]|nr:hypothetical protein [Elizabethkingia anophelis]MDV3612650.1 hypothetical protein [Elizabethkingia anophelis]MDV3655197.1 hypothetical protein [Elizabethkingia anophelis]MDV3894646.1 hypothetical protein [Elizabethkingia anophelis]MDV3917973.1 hypothetical protein [Elizabethkingia anophelis]
MKEIDLQIDKNLEYLYNHEDKAIHSHRFIDVNGRELTSKFNGDQFIKEMEFRKLVFNKNNLWSLTDFGYEIIELGGWIKYLEHEKERKQLEKQKSNEETEKLKLELEVLRNTVKDYPKTKFIAKASFATAIISIIISIWQLLK